MMDKIKDFALGIFDGPHATPKESNEGAVFLGIKNITPEGRLDFSNIRYVSEEELPKWTRRVIPQKDDVVLSYEATLHRYALIPEGFRGCLGRRMALIRPDQDKLHPRFLHYYFLSPKWRNVIDSNIIIGATVNRIPIKNLPDFEVDFPTLAEQSQIASILSAYDDLIENNRRRIQLLEESARLLYKEWFVHLRFPGHEHTKIIDGVPEGWKRGTLGECAVLNYGKALKKDNRTVGDCPVYGSSGVVGSHNKAIVKAPALIIGRKGNVGSVYWTSCDCWPIDTVYFIHDEESDLYLYHALKNTAFMSTDVAVPGLNRNFAYSRTLLIPGKKIRAEFIAKASLLRWQIEKLDQYNQKLAEARDLLLPRLMNGEIQV